MNSDTSDPGAATARQEAAATKSGLDASGLLLERGKADLHRLMEEAMRSADPQIATVIDRFRRELDASVKRTVDDFVNLPTVHRVMQDWTKAGLPENDITFLIVDVAALLDLRSTQSHKDQARLVGMLSDAVLAVAHVYSLAYQESVAARKEAEGTRKQLEGLARSNAAVLKQLEQTCGVMRSSAQQSYDLTVILGQTKMRTMAMWVGTGIGCLLVGAAITWLLMR
jgi:hypothetical protein